MAAYSYDVAWADCGTAFAVDAIVKCVPDGGESEFERLFVRKEDMTTLKVGSANEANGANVPGCAASLMIFFVQTRRMAR